MLFIVNWLLNVEYPRATYLAHYNFCITKIWQIHRINNLLCYLLRIKLYYPRKMNLSYYTNNQIALPIEA